MIKKRSSTFIKDLNFNASRLKRKMSSQFRKIIATIICDSEAIKRGDRRNQRCSHVTHVYTYTQPANSKGFAESRDRGEGRTFVSSGRGTTASRSHDGSQCSQIRAHVTESALAVGSVLTAPLYQSLGRWLSCSRPSTITLRSPCHFCTAPPPYPF